MEMTVKAAFPDKIRVAGKMVAPKVHLVRYADDFIVTAQSKEMLEAIKQLLTNFLAARGLTLSEEKTLITHIDDGFDFLGFNIRKYNGKLLIKPSKKSIKRMLDNLHEVIAKCKSYPQRLLIVALNRILVGWGNYFRHVVSKRVFAMIDHVLVCQLKRWATRRHPNKSHRWAIDKYFHTVGGRKWTFCDIINNGNKQKILQLKKLADIPIVRHVKVKSAANPFDPAWDLYFKSRSAHSMSANRPFRPATVVIPA